MQMKGVTMATFNSEPIKIDLEQVADIYTSMSELIYGDMDQQYKEGKIHGPDYANTWAGLMNSVIGGALQAVVSLQSNETEADRCLKQEQCDASKASTVNDTCRATADCKVKDEQAKQIIEQTELTKTQEAEIKAESCRKDGLTEAEHKLKSIQADKVAYERNNILPVSLELTNRQIAGFDDNINIKVMESMWSYNAMITASGIGSGIYQEVDPVPLAGYSKIPSNPAPAYDTFDADGCPSP